MGQHTPVEADKTEIAKAESMWGNFMNITKWTVISISILLLGMAAVFVPFSS